jgi:hypothetical protein
MSDVADLKAMVACLTDEVRLLASALQLQGQQIAAWCGTAPAVAHPDYDVAIGLKAVGKMIGAHEKTAAKLVRDGELPRIQEAEGHRVRVLVSDVLAYLHKHRIDPATNKKASARAENINWSL